MESIEEKLEQKNVSFDNLLAFMAKPRILISDRNIIHIKDASDNMRNIM